MIGVPEELTELKAQVRAINSALLIRSACYYCADVATCEDHVIPHSLLHNRDTSRKGWEVDTLPSCRECNSLLSSAVTDTLEDRRALLADKVRKRYLAHLDGEAWTPNELANVSINLLGYALEFNQVKAHAESRLAHLMGLHYIPPIQYEGEIMMRDKRSSYLFEPIEIDTEEEYLAWHYERARFIPRVRWKGQTCYFQAEAQPYPIKREDRVFHRRKYGSGARLVAIAKPAPSKDQPYSTKVGWAKGLRPAFI